MLDTMKAASKSTAFEQWLDVAMGRGAAPPGLAEAGIGGSGSPGSGGGTAGAAGGAGGVAGGGAGAGGPAAPTHQEEMAATLAEVAQYLAKQGMAGGGAAPTDPASIAADSSRFRWVAAALVFWAQGPKF